jgi:hypothetical protein
MPCYTRAEAEAAIGQSLSYAAALRKLGLTPTGGNHKVLRHWVEDVWKISTDHFDADAARLVGLKNRPVDLTEVMVEGSAYSRASLKRRLFAEGYKERRCEMCGQGELWRGERLALVLDHINGVPNDHRLENLRVLCPNCAATLPTHCGRKNRRPISPRTCLRCRKPFVPNDARQRYCSRYCGVRWDRRGRPLLGSRRAERPPYEQLVAEIEAGGYCAVGRKYGVSDNAIRKWVLAYERENARNDEAEE